MGSISFDSDVSASSRFILRYPNISFITIATIFSKISGTKMDKGKMIQLLLKSHGSQPCVGTVDLFTHFLQQSECFESGSIIVLLSWVHRTFEPHYSLPIQLNEK